LARLGDVTLALGMPVEAFIQTSTRTPLNYLLRPLTDYFARAFREE
jgi:multidrug efflux pump subunit AcrA (membrane-fusion protein)